MGAPLGPGRGRGRGRGQRGRGRGRAGRGRGGGGGRGLVGPEEGATFNVLLTHYDLIMRDKSFSSASMDIIVDEGHPPEEPRVLLLARTSSLGKPLSTIPDSTVCSAHLACTAQTGSHRQPSIPSFCWALSAPSSGTPQVHHPAAPAP